MISQLALENLRAATLNTSPFLRQSHSIQTPWKPGISLAAATSWTPIQVIMTQFSELEFASLPLWYSLKNHCFYFLQKAAVGKVIIQIHLNLHKYYWLLHWTSLSHCLPRQGLGCLPSISTLLFINKALNSSYEIATSLPAVENYARTCTAIPQSIALLLGHLLLWQRWFRGDFRQTEEGWFRGQSVLSAREARIEIWWAECMVRNAMLFCLYYFVDIIVEIYNIETRRWASNQMIAASSFIVWLGFLLIFLCWI